MLYFEKYLTDYPDVLQIIGIRQLIVVMKAINFKIEPESNLLLAKFSNNVSL